MATSRRSKQIRHGTFTDPPVSETSSPRSKHARNDPPYSRTSLLHIDLNGEWTSTDADPRKRQCQTYVPKTIPTCLTKSASSSAYSNSTASYAEEDIICPVTGIYADVTEDYVISPEVIGSGHYGVVRECFHLATNRRFAVKSVEKSRSRLDHLRREIYLLANVDYPSIMQLVDCYEDACHVHMIMEMYTGGELFEKIVASKGPHGCLSEREAAVIIRSLLGAVKYLHSKDIVHRDIKPENIVFESTDDAAIRLIDFGLSYWHGKDDKPMTTRVGTAYYMSPELLDRSYDRSCDVWAVGVVAYILLCGYPPFNGSSDKAIHDATHKGRLRFLGGKWSDKSCDAINFIQCLLRRDPRERLTAEQALTHPWIGKVTI